MVRPRLPFQVWLDTCVWSLINRVLYCFNVPSDSDARFHYINRRPGVPLFHEGFPDFSAVNRRFCIMGVWPKYLKKFNTYLLGDKMVNFYTTNLMTLHNATGTNMIRGIEDSSLKIFLNDFLFGSQ